MQFQPVVITGMGAVSGFGWGVDALQAVFKGKTAVSFTCTSPLAGAPTLPAAQLTGALPDKLMDRRLVDADRVTQMAVFAAEEALTMAGVDPANVGLVSWGTGFGGAATMDAGYTRLMFGKEDLSNRVSPLTIPKAMTHASAAGIAANFELSCPVMTYSCACASSAVAIGEAMLAIQSGRCDVALVGGSEALIVPGVVKAWESLGALARPDEHGAWRGPFDGSRNGLVLGEGAACLVLESVSHAVERVHKCLAQLRGYGHVHDPHCVTQPNTQPQLRAMQLALFNADVDRRDVSYVNAHATGTAAGDKSEIAALNNLFGDGKSSALVSSTKLATGHLMGAAGALEAVLTIETLRKGLCPPTYGVCNPDAEIRFSLPQCAQTLNEHRIGISNSFAFGGTNVSLVFGV